MPVINHLWDTTEDNIVEDFDDAGTTIADYTTEPDLYGNMISQYRSGESSWFHYDGQGSTLAVSDDTQVVGDTRAYFAFGETTESTGVAVFPFKYFGKKNYYEAGTQYAVRRRIYDPVTSRWLSKDIQSPTSGSANTYRFVENAPLLLMDLDGEQIWVFARPCPMVAPRPAIQTCTPRVFPRIYVPPPEPLPTTLPEPIPAPAPGPPLPVPFPAPYPPKGSTHPGSSPTPKPNPNPHWDPAAQDLPAPGKCTWAQYRRLNQAAKLNCKYGNTRACTFAQWDCQTWSALEHKWTQCADASAELMNTCFGGGNLAHRRQEQEYRRQATLCEGLFYWWCFGPPSTHPPVLNRLDPDYLACEELPKDTAIDAMV